MHIKVRHVKSSISHNNSIFVAFTYSSVCWIVLTPGYITPKMPKRQYYQTLHLVKFSMSRCQRTEGGPSSGCIWFLGRLHRQIFYVSRMYIYLEAFCVLQKQGSSSNLPHYYNLLGSKFSYNKIPVL